jgi:hypothetical protein
MHSEMSDWLSWTSVTQISLDSIAICSSVQKVFSRKCFKWFWTICYVPKLKCYCNKIHITWSDKGGMVIWSITCSIHITCFCKWTGLLVPSDKLPVILAILDFNRKLWKWILHCCYSFLHTVDTVGRFWQGCLQGLSMTVHFSGYTIDLTPHKQKQMQNIVICQFYFRGITRLPCAWSSVWN